ncbi:D(5)-like dopamine receptor [Hypomesus transpacificus]|uniref:D(5)-like dopamine receptor n=1 Tax=Hypomesus transpacificus TaxID=137520 RepID=UPI001F071BA0|nr:D(5)-like dopamine receptor [Hypomesus transpacificus]
MPMGKFYSHHQIHPSSDESMPDYTSGLTSVRVLTGCALFILIVSTLLGNTLVCAAVIKFRHLRSKASNSFVISLAVSDLFVSVLVMPWKAVSEVAGYWLFGDFCDTWIAFDIMGCTISIFNLCIISMDRYWAISSPFRYQRKMTQRFAFVITGMAWTLSILISFIPVKLNWHKAETENSMLDNPDKIEVCDASLNKTYAISSSLISFYIPLVIMVGAYTRIYRIARTQIQLISSLHSVVEHAQNQQYTNDENSLKTLFKKTTKAFKTLSILMGVFVFGWLPFFVLNCIVPFCNINKLGDPLCVSNTTFNTFVWFRLATSSLNPVIYAFNADFRKAYLTILGCNIYHSMPTVEAVDFPIKLVSYHHDTTPHEDPTVTPAQRPIIVHHNDLDIPFDKVPPGFSQYQM